MLKDGVRVQETTATTGTGTLSLGGAPVGYLPFVAEIGIGNSCFYYLFDANGSSWEVGIGTVDAGTLTRTTVIRSSNANAAIFLTTGNHTVINAPTPSRNFDSTRYPNALYSFSINYGLVVQENHNIGAAAEGVANVADTNIYGVGFYGSGWTNGATRCSGVVGEGHVTATGDTGLAIGIKGYALDAHTGGSNIGLYSKASGGATNYALYMDAGDIWSTAAQIWTLNGDITFAGSTFALSNVLLSGYGERVTTPAISGGILTLDLSLSNVFNVTHNANITSIVVTNPKATGSRSSFTLRLTQDATGGRTVALPANWVCTNGGVAPTFVTTANKRNKLTVETYTGGTNYEYQSAGLGY